MFRLLVENIGDVLWFKQSKPKRFTYLSPAFEGVWKCSVDVAYANSEMWDESIHPEDRSAVEEAREQWFVGAKAEYEVEYRIVNYLGETRWLADRGIILSRRDGRPFEIAGIARDITERRQDEDERARLAAVVESSEDAIMTLDLRGVIQTWNVGAETIFGYTAAEVIGRPVAMLRPIEAADDEMVFQEHIRQGRRIHHYETVRRRKDGVLIDISISISPLRDRQGRLFGFSKISRDITRRRQAELMLQQLNGELENRVAERTAALREANEALQSLIERRRELEREVLNISEHEQRRIGQDLHDDLGQQIAGAWMMSSVLQRALGKRSAPEEGQAARISQLLGEALNHTRTLARGLHPVAPKEGGLEAALQQLAARGKTLFGIECQFITKGNCGLEDPAVTTHLYRVAQEALSNAVKHGEAKLIRITLSCSPREVRLIIDDDGHGIRQGEVGQVGMGLRIMRYRVDMIGAKLEIGPRKPRGTRVQCQLPMK